MTNDVRYARPEDRELHDVLTAIRHGRSVETLAELRTPSGEHYLKSGPELAALPPGDAAADPATAVAWREGIANAGELAAACRVDLGFEQYRFPGFPVPAGETAFSYLAELCHGGIRRRYHPVTPPVVKQLAHELDVIERTGLAEFFLICWDLMRFAKERRIPAQGRGSAADSIVAYVLGITRVDPIRHNLLFERFINEGRTTYPDVDIDFSSERREEVIQYVYERYGAEHTGMVCNLVTYRARSAVREVGTALGFPRPLVDRVAKALETYDSVMVRRDLEADGGFAEFFRRPDEVRDGEGSAGRAGESAAGRAVDGSAALAEQRGLVDRMGQLDHAGAAHRHALQAPAARADAISGPAAGADPLTAPQPVAVSPAAVRDGVQGASGVVPGPGSGSRAPGDAGRGPVRAASRSPGTTASGGIGGPGPARGADHGETLPATGGSDTATSWLGSAPPAGSGGLPRPESAARRTGILPGTGSRAGDPGRAASPTTRAARGTRRRASPGWCVEVADSSRPRNGRVPRDDRRDARASAGDRARTGEPHVRARGRAAQSSRGHARHGGRAPARPRVRRPRAASPGRRPAGTAAALGPRAGSDGGAALGLGPAAASGLAARRRGRRLVRRPPRARDAAGAARGEHRRDVAVGALAGAVRPDRRLSAPPLHPQRRDARDGRARSSTSRRSSGRRCPGRVVVQFDKRDVETLKLIKLDLLGLGMLAAIDETIQLIEHDCAVCVDLDRLPEEIPEVFAMLQAADTVGVFQVESRAQMQTLPKSRPTCLDDLVVEVAIIRPGPIQGNAVHPYLRRKQGLEPVTYLHPSLEPVLRDSLGVILYQEQVMRIAIEVAGFTPAASDGFRRAMGTWRSPAEMEKLHAGFVEGCVTVQGMPRADAEELYRRVAGFASFGFAKSHAAAFARTAYESSFLKLFYPAQFLVGLVNAQPMGFYPVEVLVNDAKRHGVAVLPVDVNASAYRTTTEWVGRPGWALAGPAGDDGRHDRDPGEPLPPGLGDRRPPPPGPLAGLRDPGARGARALDPGEHGRLGRPARAPPREGDRRRSTRRTSTPSGPAGRTRRWPTSWTGPGSRRRSSSG